MKRTNIGVFVTLTSALASGAAIAQDSPLEEIIVTAERREQSLQDVPLSITAFGDETRDRVGILSIQSMADFAPGFSYNTSTDRPTIRGIGRQSNTFSLDSPVANYVDGVYTSSVQDAQRRPLFIERTEILRGPQGALSGRGSIAGAINTIYKRPDDEFGGEVRVSGGTYARYIVDATVTGPLIGEWLRGRLNLGITRQDEGYFENVANNKTEGDQPNNREGIDVLLAADLGDNVDVYLKMGGVDYDESRRSLASTAPYVAGTQNAPTPYVSGGPTGLTPLASYGVFDPSVIQVGTQTENPVVTTGDLRKYNTDFPSRQKLDDHHNITLEVVWSGPGFDLKYLGAHQNYKYTQWTDADNTPVTSYILPMTARRVNVGGYIRYMEEREWYSNELNFTSTHDGPIQWIAGLYQSNEDYYQEPQSTYFPGFAELNNPAWTTGEYLGFVFGAFPPAFFGGPPPTTVPAPNPEPFRAQFGSVDGLTVSSAVFGQVDFSPNDVWKFTAGLRYNEDEKEVTEAARFILNGGQFGAFMAGASLATDGTPAAGALPKGVVADYGINPVTGYRVRDMKETWSAVTGSLGVDFTPIDNHLFYFRYAKGYRPGGFDAGFIFDDVQVEKESLNAYELGWKATIADQLQISTSVFYYDYEDIQQPVTVLGRCTDPNDITTCSVFNSFINLPSAVNKGVEIEATWSPIENLSFLFTYGFLDATIKDGLVGNGLINTVDPAAVLPSANRFVAVGDTDVGYTYLPRYTQDLSGNTLPDSSKHKFALNGSYTFNFAPGDLTLSLSYNWRDSQYNDLFESKVGETPSYKLVGLRALWTDSADRYTVIVYGSNLTDEDAADSSPLIGVRQRTGLASAASPSAAGQAYYKSYNLVPPREYGVEVQYRF